MAALLIFMVGVTGGGGGKLKKKYETRSKMNYCPLQYGTFVFKCVLMLYLMFWYIYLLLSPERKAGPVF